MSAVEILEQIDHLPPAERQVVVEKMREKYGTFDDLFPGEAELIASRLQDHRQNPDDVVSLEDVKAKLDVKYRK
jgi:hypothetical protein